DKFGLLSYGCCEPLDQKFDVVIRSFPNLRRISVAPWTNREVAAARLRRSSRPSSPVFAG
ncbi:MAG: hypothetical protein ACFFDF_25760, partial [Candidatus Odinarchaeota archaeon]